MRFPFSEQLPISRLNGTMHIVTYVQETFALHEVLKLATTTHPGCLKEGTAVVDVDNKTMHAAFKKGRSAG